MGLLKVTLVGGYKLWFSCKELCSILYAA